VEGQAELSIFLGEIVFGMIIEIGFSLFIQLKNQLQLIFGDVL